MSDVRAALRILCRSPLFAVAVIATLGLGIGLTTAMFAAVHAWILAPLPYPDEARLISLHETIATGRSLGISKDDLRDLRTQAHSLESAAALLPRTFGLGGRDQPAVVLVGMFTGDPFRVLGMPPSLGRSPEPDDELPGRTKVVWVSHAAWRVRFGADSSLPGKTLRLNEEPYLIAGILAQGFAFPLGGKVPELYIPLDGYEGRSTRTLTGIGRLSRGSSSKAAQAELQEISARLASLAPETNTGIGVALGSLHDELAGDQQKALWLLLGAVCLLLLVACTNVGNLRSIRAIGRQREMAIRLCLGASGRQLLKQSFVEGCLVCFAGSLCGLVLAQLAISLLVLLPQFVPAASGIAQLQSPRLSPLVIAFALLLASAIALAFAPLPAAILRRMDPQKALRDGEAAGISATAGGLRGILIAGEVALSVVLLANCGLLLRSLENVIHRNPGFEAEGVIAFGIGLPEARYASDEKLLAFHQQALQKLAALPGVKTAGAVWPLPLTRKRPNLAFQIPGDPFSAPRHTAAVAVASKGYFETMRIPVVRGRSFEGGDDPRRPGVVTVNRAFAGAYFPNGEAVGKRISFRWDNGAAAEREIVGVVGDTPELSFDEAIGPQLYLSLGQAPAEGVFYVMRGSLTADALAPSARESIRSIDSLLEKLELHPLSFWIDNALTDRRATASLLGFFAVTALMLSALGIFAAVSYAVRRQLRELGIRVALGATRARILRLVAARGSRPVVLGVAAGLLGALWSSQLVRNQLVDLSPADPATIFAVVLLVGLVAMAACMIPALRASSVDPMIVLRED
jgi:putative ABC transport system permease protein